MSVRAASQLFVARGGCGFSSEDAGPPDGERGLKGYSLGVEDRARCGGPEHEILFMLRTEGNYQLHSVIVFMLDGATSVANVAGRELGRL